jgi:hypothetical protein
LEKLLIIYLRLIGKEYLEVILHGYGNITWGRRSVNKIMKDENSNSKNQAQQWVAGDLAKA